MSRTILCLLLTPLLLAGCSSNPPVDPTSLEVGATIPLTSTAFAQGQPISKRHARISSNLSPPLAWSGAPPGVKSYALICDDPDARGGAFVHWIIWNIPGDAHELPENVPAVPTLPDGARQGKNDYGGVGYGGPDPPARLHHYYFRLYALDALLDLPEYSTTRQDLERSMKGHVLGHGELMGTYQK